MKVVKLNVFPPAPARAYSSSSRYSSSSSSLVIFDVWGPLSYKLTKIKKLQVNLDRQKRNLNFIEVSVMVMHTNSSCHSYD
jgi:hypothetical protein